MPSSIALWAGGKAFSRIKQGKIGPDDVKIIAGAAGGPKWLILNHLDRALFSSWLNLRKSTLFMVGSSIGAWRMATVSAKNPTEAIDCFQDAYLDQVFGFHPPMHKVNRVIETVLDKLLESSGINDILSHPWYRLNIMAVRCKGMTASDKKAKLAPALAMAALGNTVARKTLGLFFERTLFYDPRDIPPFYAMNGFPIRQVPLSTENIKPALMASGSVPLLMPGVKDIPGAPPGVYRDGGIIDYHMNINFMNNPDGLNKQDGITLFPHYSPQFVPGWLDKKIFWRGPDFSFMDQVLMITPAKEFINRLPYGKITDRSDFTRFAGKDKERVEYWKTVIDMGRQLADEFMEALETGKIIEMVRPISTMPYKG